MKANTSRRPERRWGRRLRLAAMGFIGVALMLAHSLEFDQGGGDGWAIGTALPLEDQTPNSIQGGNAWNWDSSKVSKNTNAVLAGRVTYVQDGDTIEVSGRPLRFANLDCAELGTRSGNRAKQLMSALVEGKTVSCKLTGHKSYARWIGSCRLSDGRDIASSMVQKGACNWWHG